MAAGNQNQSFVQNTELDTDFSSWSTDIIGSYSIDAQGNFYNNDQRELRSLIPNYDSKCGSDLTAGFDPSVKEHHYSRPLDSLLDWIVLNKDTISRTGNGPGKQRLDADFVFTVGTMRRLLATVFNTGSYKQPWKMYAIKYNSTIYIRNGENTSEERRPEEERKDVYMGLKFEELISKLEPCESQGKPADRKVDGRQGFYSVRRGIFGGGHLVLTRAQVDFVENGKTYLECKLCPNYTGQDEWKFPMYKLRNWWYHMYAANMKHVICGRRDGTTLERVNRIERSEIPYQVKNPRMSCPPAIQSALKSWNPLESVGFVDKFLQRLKRELVDDSFGMDGGRAVQYVLEWKKDESLIGSSREEASMSNVLPDWYNTKMSAFFA